MKSVSLFQKLLQLSLDDLHKKLNQARRDLCGLRLSVATARVKDTSQYKVLRKHIACIMTAIRAKEIATSVVK